MEGETQSEAILRHQLEIQIRRINRVLKQHQIPATVSGGSVRSHVTSFDLQTRLVTGLELAGNLKDDLLRALGVSNISLRKESGRWQLHLPQPDVAPVPLLELLATTPNIPFLTIPIGLTGSDGPIDLSFSPIAGFPVAGHILISGERGAGKTSLLRTIGVGFALTNRQADCQLQIMDPAEVGKSARPSSLLPLAYLPHMLTDPSLGIEACENIIHFLAEEMTYRWRERVRLPHIVVLIDHVLTYLVSADHEARDDLLRLLQYGNRAGIHLVMATDRIDHPGLESIIRAGVTRHIVGRSGDVVAMRRLVGVAVDNALLLQGSGDFLSVTGEEVRYFQAAYIGDYDLHLKLSRLIEAQSPRLLARSFSDRPRLKLQSQKACTFKVREGDIDIQEDKTNIIPGISR